MNDDKTNKLTEMQEARQQLRGVAVGIQSVAQVGMLRLAAGTAVYAARIREVDRAARTRQKQRAANTHWSQTKRDRTGREM